MKSQRGFAPITAIAILTLVLLAVIGGGVTYYKFKFPKQHEVEPSAPEIAVTTSTAAVILPSATSSESYGFIYEEEKYVTGTLIPRRRVVLYDLDKKKATILKEEGGFFATTTEPWPWTMLDGSPVRLLVIDGRLQTEDILRHTTALYFEPDTVPSMYEAPFKPASQILPRYSIGLLPSLGLFTYCDEEGAFVVSNILSHTERVYANSNLDICREDLTAAPSPLFSPDGKYLYYTLEQVEESGEVSHGAISKRLALASGEVEVLPDSTLPINFAEFTRSNFSPDRKLYLKADDVLPKEGVGFITSAITIHDISSLRVGNIYDYVAASQAPVIARIVLDSKYESSVFSEDGHGLFYLTCVYSSHAGCTPGEYKMGYYDLAAGKNYFPILENALPRGVRTIRLIGALDKNVLIYGASFQSEISDSIHKNGIDYNLNFGTIAGYTEVIEYPLHNLNVSIIAFLKRKAPQEAP